ncbi:Large cysteine-rich periplasmic protein OmcB precursor [Aquisphaera giovannonii]|uniref:Large cysteine-rich periplasmic protein OmcB n=1 Tax=Aquisphaera giovannonii TaxID=406548 RepID=A0A5B9W5Z5_9BACT|nr:DUF11 domain-containing protein [Aquisphaera giovannonii]QEH35569.1 Large cysteine-rich periplasmic protein OmcB precursor [Aquisphaera giovannonii]
MGRRILILMAILMPTLAARPAARGQDPPLPAPAPPDDAGAPLPPAASADESPIRIPAGQDGDLPSLPHAGAEEPAASKPGTLASKPEKAAGKAGAKASEKKAAAPPKTPRPEARPRLDEDVQRTEGAGLGDPAAPPAAANPATPPAAAPPASEPATPAGSGFAIPADQVPMGKHEVVLSVEVQAPPDIVFNREHTAKLIVRNSGSADAAGVVVHDELPPGLEYVGAQPEAERPAPNLLAWTISNVSAGTERVILLKVKPTKADGAVDHAATVTFQAGSKATSRILKPQLKVEVVQTPSEGKVLKHKTAEYRISITNTGNGPARDVVVKAVLSKGLRYGSVDPGEDNSLSNPIPKLVAGQRMDLDALQVEAAQGGEQTCVVRATSPDVDFDQAVAEASRRLEVVEPKLKVNIDSHDKRYTDTVAPYTITLENEGTAPARNVRVTATLGMSGRLVATPPGAKYDPATRRLSWTVPLIEPHEKARTFAFEVRMGGVGQYEALFDVKGDTGISFADRRITDVEGLADVDLVVREKRRVVDVDGTTTFQVYLRNYGTKEATKVLVTAKLSDNMKVEETGGHNAKSYLSKETGEIVFPVIERLGAGKEMLLTIKVKVVKPEPKMGTCRVFCMHDGLDPNGKLEDMAGVKIGESRRTASVGGR